MIYDLSSEIMLASSCGRIASYIADAVIVSLFADNFRVSSAERVKLTRLAPHSRHGYESFGIRVEQYTQVTVRGGGGGRGALLGRQFSAVARGHWQRSDPPPVPFFGVVLR